VTKERKAAKEIHSKKGDRLIDVEEMMDEGTLRKEAAEKPAIVGPSPKRPF
jgi:hypothetical protein